MPPDLIKRFCEEGLDALRSFSSSILALERESDPVPLYADMLRMLHSMKGSARMLGLSEIGEVMHATEDVISLLSQSPDNRPDELVNTLLLISDSLQEALVAVHAGEHVPPLDQLLSGIETLQLMLTDHLQRRLDVLAAQSPEVFQVLNVQQRELVLRSLQQWRRLFVLELSFRRTSFAADVRSVHATLNDVGLLIATTGTKALPSEGFDLKFQFLAFSSVDEDEVLGLLDRFAPQCTEIRVPSTREIVADVMDVPAPAFSVPALSAAEAVRVEPLPPPMEPAAPPNPVSSSPPVDPEFLQLQRMFLEESDESLKLLNREILSLERAPSTETVNSIFRAFHNLKGSGGSYGFPAITRVAHLLESYVQPMRGDVRVITQHAIGNMLRGVDELEKLFGECRRGRHDEYPIERIEQELRELLVPEIDVRKSATEAHVDRPVVKQTPALRAPDSMRVNLRKIDGIVNAAIELSIAHNAEHALLANFDALVEKSQRQLVEWQSLRDALLREGVSLSDAVLQQMTTFSSSLGELHERLGDLDRAVDTNFSLWKSLADALSNDVLQLQLQPLSTLFEIFERIVRDLAQALGKNVTLDIQGGDVEVDRRIIDALKDPFVHLLRNSIDHGIESPAERKQGGKTERGRLRVTAQQMGFSFAVSITDDGRGLDREQIVRIAVARQLLTPQQAAALGNAEVYRLLFRPGFSTRDVVTDISGRGVGLDVVATNVHQLGGEVFVTSEPGHGTTFQIVLPTTLTLSRVLLLEVDDRLFSFPVTGTEQIVLLTASSMQSFYGRVVTQWNDQLVPVVLLEDLLGIPHSTRRVRNGLILRTGESLLCLSVPRVVDETELMTKPLPPHLRKNRIITGANVLADGRISLFINPRLATEHVNREGRSLPIEGGDVARRSADTTQSGSAAAIPASAQHPGASTMRPGTALHVDAASSHAGETGEGVVQHADWARFWVAPDEVEERADAEAAPGRRRVLVVDDSLIARELLRNILSAQGCEVALACDGQEAIMHLRAHVVDLVVTDVDMPLVDGCALTRMVREDPALRHIPVIIVSSREEPEQRRLGIAAGADAYIPKGTFHQNNLLATIERLLAGRDAA
jgi:two-component system, chemotaxis family, sensor kinase CheA